MHATHAHQRCCGKELVSRTLMFLSLFSYCLRNNSKWSSPLPPSSSAPPPLMLPPRKFANSESRIVRRTSQQTWLGHAPSDFHPITCFLSGVSFGGFAVHCLDLILTHAALSQTFHWSQTASRDPPFPPPPTVPPWTWPPAWESTDSAALAVSWPVSLLTMLNATSMPSTPEGECGLKR